MFRSHLIPGAAALAACILSCTAVAAGPVHVIDPLPDARILSAAPFQFKADRGIFSLMPAEPTDSRIFKQGEPVHSAGEPRLQDRFKRRLTI